MISTHNKFQHKETDYSKVLFLSETSSKTIKDAGCLFIVMHLCLCSDLWYLSAFCSSFAYPGLVRDSHNRCQLKVSVIGAMLRYL